jgi:hypothetical protein
LPYGLTTFASQLAPFGCWLLASFGSVVEGTPPIAPIGAGVASRRWNILTKKLSIIILLFILFLFGRFGVLGLPVAVFMLLNTRKANNYELCIMDYELFSTFAPLYFQSLNTQNK